MMDRELAEAFNNCIDRLAAGQSIEDCLRAYPHLAAALRPMLEAGQLTRRAAPDAAEIARSQEQGRARLEAALRTYNPPQQKPEYRIGPLTGLARLAAGLLLVLGAAAGGLSAAAQDSLPGDALYGLKLFTEQVQLTMRGPDEGLLAGLEERRIDEVQRLLAAGRAADVSFRGQVLAITGETPQVWLVAGLEVIVEDPDAMPRAALTGTRVEVMGSTTADGRLIAHTIQPLEGDEVTPLPVEEASPTAEATSTPAPTATLPRPTATHTQTARPAASPTPQPTRTPLPQETRPEAASCQPQRPAGWSAYFVQPGDSVAILAQRSGTSVERVVFVNCLDNPDVITTGQRLYLPAMTAPTATEAAQPDGPEGDTRPPAEDTPARTPVRPTPTETPQR